MKFPSFIQYDTMDCGAAALKIIAKYYGQDIPLSYLRELMNLNREGVSLLQISRAAETIGFRTLGVKKSFKQLKEKVPLPAIIHWNQNHFVVVYKIKGRNNKEKIFISDPALGLTEYKKQEFLKYWLSHKQNNNDLGIALLLEPTVEFFNLKNAFTHFLFTLP